MGLRNLDYASSTFTYYMRLLLKEAGKDTSGDVSTELNDIFGSVRKYVEGLDKRIAKLENTQKANSFSFITQYPGIGSGDFIARALSRDDLQGLLDLGINHGTFKITVEKIIHPTGE